MLHVLCLHKHPSSRGGQTPCLDTQIPNPCQPRGKQGRADGDAGHAGQIRTFC